MKNIFANWNFMRVLRLALGLFIAIQGFMTMEWLFIALGGLFILMPLMNTGCCSGARCNTPSEVNKDKQTEDLSFEEIK